ncbi:MAG TPA: MBL fold metallo-hydrolase [Polyangia bacterium]|jgi:ribonuclease BN (tRNA processing enzyme)
MPLEVIVLGVGDAFSERYHPSALLLRCDGFTLAVDCPDMYRAALRRAGARAGLALSVGAVDAFLITHVHGDHVNGLEAVAFYTHYVERRRVMLLGGPALLATLWEQRLRAAMGRLWDGQTFREMTQDDYFDARPLSATGPTEVGPFRITTRATRHHVPTTALLVEAAGRRLGYSSDTAFDPELIDFLAPADLVIHETNLGPAHTPYGDLLRLAPALRARLRLIHYPDELDPAASAIACLHEGEVLHV